MLIILLSFLILLIPNQARAHLNDGLVGWWKFDETSGDAIDSSGQGNTGTPTGTTIVANCKRGGCRKFNGAGDNVAIPNYDHSTTASITGWFYLTATPAAWTQIVATWLGGGAEVAWGVGLYWDSSCPREATRLYFQLYGGLGIRTVYVTPSGSISPNQYYHFAAVRNGATSEVYLNGVLQTLDTCYNTNGTSSAYNAANPIKIGGSVVYFPGFIDDVRIYNRALTAQEVKDLYIPGIKLNNGVFRNAHFNQ